MSDQLLPDFDGPGSASEPPSPRKPRPRPTRKPAKKVTKRVKLPVSKPAKRVPKKRRARKAPKQIAAKIHEVTGFQFDIESWDMVRKLLALDANKRNLVIAIAQGLSGK